ncbi:type 1 glutamine amidotransferase domain-containing protein [Caballeronia sp. LjRoot34]|uniref:type 1 glutamine amidotransferase domain-containing protein n=1 Tax=Caballeronia sp. LjRoot34 TaxID=3342325 RepID=UPI003ECDD6E6
MKALFVISSFENGAWLSEITHPYWHLIERDVEVDFASPKGGKVGWSPYSDPYAEGTTEPHDLVSKGFLSDPSLMARLATTLALQDVELDQYDAVHVAGGQGATFDLYPNKDLAKVLEHFWMREKIVAAICHGAIALGNIPELIRGRRVTGYPAAGDRELERLFGAGFIPSYPQKVLEETGARYQEAGTDAPCVVIDGKLLTGQNQQSASEYGIVLYHLMSGHSPVVSA